ncbi:MAG: VOC family protein [Planctomycetota bacterium]|jgi:uncharacterized glyoxalase superfamily protein PhnB
MSGPAQFPNSIMLTANSLQESIAFYVDVCGFTVKESWPEGNDPMWANLDLGGQSVMIGSAMQPEQVEGMCAEEPKELEWHKTAATEFQEHPAGIGAYLYLKVDDVDAFHAKVIERGGKPITDPKSQFYGLRVFGIHDPTGYRLLFYSPLAMENCQSCGMPMTDAEPGLMYCDYCTDEEGKLRSFEDVLEGTIQGYFMGMQKMERGEAEVAAKEMLAKMPAWNPEACG